MKKNNKNKFKILTALLAAVIVTITAACSSNNKDTYELSNEDNEFKTQLTNILKNEFTSDTVSVEVINSANEEDVIVTVIFDDKDLNTRQKQNKRFIDTFETVKVNDNEKNIESLHVNYSDGDRLFSIYDLPDFQNANEDNLTERVTILDLDTDE